MLAEVSIKVLVKVLAIFFKKSIGGKKVSIKVLVEVLAIIFQRSIGIGTGNTFYKYC